MRPFSVTALALSLLALGPLPTIVVAQTQLGPEGTPQVEASTESLRYAEAATPQLLTHYWIVLYEVDNFPRHPTPQQVKESELRKRILDLRLLMDLNAFAFEPGSFEAYRDALDGAYEQIGLYKDLFDVQALDGAPIDPVEQAERLAKMNVALAPFRLESFREDLKAFFYARTGAPLALEWKDQPRLWQIAGRTPTDDLDSLGNAALLAQSALRSLRGQGLLIGNIFDPVEEEHFHDIRKALRSIELLTDMFPTLTAATADVREPLDEVISAYGKTNDQINAYRLAQLSGREVDRRAAELQAAHARAQELAAAFVNSGQLDAYAARLEGRQLARRR